MPASQELSVAKYCYDAGNVNLYQAEQISKYYGIKALPAVVVDGQHLSSVSAGSILKALQEERKRITAAPCTGFYDRSLRQDLMYKKARSHERAFCGTDGQFTA